jgi:hypothetical protein
VSKHDPAPLELHFKRDKLTARKIRYRAVEDEDTPIGPIADFYVDRAYARDAPTMIIRLERGQ